MAYQDKNLKYTNAGAYDKRGEFSVLEKYVLGFWQPFLKDKISKLSAGKIVADLGCGTCEYTVSAKAAKKIYAIDNSDVMLKACHEKLKDFDEAEVIKSDIEDFKIIGSADLILAIGVWEYINPEKLFKKIKEITRHSSQVVAVFPNIYNDLNWERSIVKEKMIALRPGYIKKLFLDDFRLIESTSFGNVCWFPKGLQFLALPLWKFSDFIYKPFQKFLPLGINVYYLFERK